MSEDIIINESFDEEDLNLFDKLEEKKFDSQELFELKLESEEMSASSEINELISFNIVKKNLEYNLPHQTEGALKIIRDMNCTALLADEVGLGKTITAGLVIKESIIRGFVKNILILTPPSLVDQWVHEMRNKFDMEFHIIENPEDWDKYDLAIASIDRVKIFNKNKGMFNHAKAHNISWDLLIVDEAHKLKERSTVRWKFVDQIQKKRFLILTATPFQNDLLELYNLLHLLKRGHLGTIKEFRRKFLSRGNKRLPLNPKELRKKLEEVMVRRRRSQTNIDYKQRRPKIISVELTPKEMGIYEATLNLVKTQYFAANGDPINGKLIVFAILPKITSSSRSAIESLQRILNDTKYHQKTKEIAWQILQEYKTLDKDSKIDKLLEIVGEIRKKDPKDKILIYTRHPTTLSYIVEKLKPFNYRIIEFAGGLTREEKFARVRQFKHGGDIFISTDAGAEGLNFQFCRNLINYDLPWNPMSVEQRIGRLDRIGQKRDMNIYSLATKGTMEEYVVDLIINKMCCVGLVIGELPIILFNLGLDGQGFGGAHKVEEMLMMSFLESKNNLDVFSNQVLNIEKIIQEGIESYGEDKDASKKLFGEEKFTEGVAEAKLGDNENGC